MPRAILPILGTLAAAALGALGSSGSRELYAQLDQPDWAPPAAAFGPVWTLLYILMATAAVLVVRRADRHSTGAAMALFGAQLALNALWPWLFFHWRLGGAAMLEILVLLAVLLLTAAAFARVHRLAAALLLPYIAWVGLAAALTWSVWRRNPELMAAVTSGVRLMST